MPPITDKDPQPQNVPYRIRNDVGKVRQIYQEIHHSYSFLATEVLNDDGGPV